MNQIRLTEVKSSVIRLRMFFLLSLVLALSILLYVEQTSTVHAVDIIKVDSLEDGSAADDHCTLREAITAANSDLSVDGCTKGNGDDVIEFSVNGVIYLGSELVITGNIVMNGPGATNLTLRGVGTDRIMYIGSGADVTLLGLTIADGRATDGGGIYNQGTLTITNSIIGDNQAIGNPGVDGADKPDQRAGGDGNGGGIYNDIQGRLAISHSIIVNNGAHGGRGGSGFCMGPSVDCLGFTGGFGGDGYGGGVFNYGALTIQNSTLSDNFAMGGDGGSAGKNVLTPRSGGDGGNGYGGSVYHAGSNITLQHATVSENAVSAGSGGPNQYDSDLSGNDGNAHGGGIFSFVGNAHIKNIILANNIANQGPDCYGNLTSQDYNLIESIADCVIDGNTTNNVVNQDPLLGPLLDNGGDTPTSAFLRLDQSNAFNAIPSNNCLPNDQRRVSRPQGNKCDIGAYESDDLQARVYWGNEVGSGALIYHKKANQTSNYTLTGSSQGTDDQGYSTLLRTVETGDSLVALVPISLPTNLDELNAHQIRLYYTNASPTTGGVEPQPVLVVKPAVQTLTVSSQNKLLLFDLDVALEWDARKDAQFLSQLAFNLQRTSQLLFDWTNGQAALGQVRIFHDAKRNTAVTGLHPWGDSHIRIYATNRMRPSATVGGIISPTLLVSETVILDGQPKTITYGAGQVRMGAIWNRYGEATGTLGEDWPRALAHELGHYLFFLEDDYLGLNEQGLLVTIPAEGDPAKSCPGAMNDPYRDSQSEFHPAADWLTSGCVKTLAHQSTGRPDWKTIYDFYGLTQPTESFSGQNLGPNTLPLAVTQLDVISPDTDEQTVVVPIFYLTSAEGSTYLPSSNAQAYLFQDEWLTDLGQPTLDQVQAWGARPGDRLCIFEAATGHRGCEQITDLDDQVAMNKADLWQPEITVSPVTSRTIAVSMTVAADGARLAARLYPTDQPASPCIFVNPVGIGHYAGLFPTLNEPALDGYIHVWVQSNVSLVCSEPQGTAVKEVMTAYAIGGNPVHVRSRRTLTRGGGVHVRSRRAPAISADGQVMVFGAALETMEEEEWFFTLQASSILPHIPPGRTLVGQAYRLTASANAPDLSNTSISFGYLGEQVPPSEEGFLRLYFWDTNADACQPNSHPCWRPLTTFTDAAYNVASAKTQGTGLYALMSSLEIPLPNAGWNSFAYPVPGTRPVEEALAAIKGAYTIVYGYQQTNVPGFWSAYSPAAPDWVNDLSALTFGQGYWIYTTKASTLYFGSQEVIQSASVESLTPPAIYYGTVTATPSFTPLAGMAVSAWIDGYQCGSGQIQEQGGEFVYVIKVEADDASIFAGCGGIGRIVTFQINHMTTDAHADWDNKRVQNVQLSAQPERHVFLPLIQR